LKTLILSGIIIILLCSCNSAGRHPQIGKHKVTLVALHSDTVVIYETKKVRIHFDKKDIIDYCKKMLLENEYIVNIRDLKSFLVNNVNTQIVLSDSIVTRIDTGRTIDRKNGGYKDTIENIPDSRHLQTRLADAMLYAAIDVLRDGRSKIFDKSNEIFVTYILYDNIESAGHGEVKIYLPNDTLILSALLWIK
jgi:hypothetical protein